MPRTCRLTAIRTCLLIAGSSLFPIAIDAQAAGLSHTDRSARRRCAVAKRSSSHRKSAHARRHHVAANRSCAKRRPAPPAQNGTSGEGPTSAPPAPALSPPEQSSAASGSSAPSVVAEAVPSGTQEPTGSTGSTGSAASFRFFSPSSVWNEPLPTDAALDPHSSELVKELESEVVRELLTETGPWINTTSDSVPVYTVEADQPTVSVELEGGLEPALASSWQAVPLPPAAQPAAGTDKALVVWQPSTDRMWEFWRLSNTGSGWSASWGGSMQDVSSNPGVYGPEAWPGAQTWWGSSATSLALVGGLITLQDLQRGRIEHALAMAIPNVRAGVYALPAQRDDGRSENPLSLPEGAHLRLDPSLDLSTLHLSPLALMIAEAAQRYGIIVRDKAGNITFFGEDPTPTHTNPYAGPGGYFEGKYPSQILSSFPWSHLQVLSMILREG